MRKARSLKKELIYSFLTIAFFSIALLGVFQIYQLSSLIKENQSYQVQTTKYLSDYIENYVLDYKKAIQTAALNVKEPLINNDFPEIQKQLENIKTNYPGFVNMYVGDREGQSIVFYPETYTDGAQSEHLDFSDRHYYKELVKTKDTVISPVYHGRGGTDKLLISIVSPILNNEGEMIGYILGALDLNALGEHIIKRSFGEGGHAVVIDQEKNVIAHPDVDTRRELVNLNESDIVKFIEEQQNNGGRGFFELENQNEDVYITYEEISNLNWTIWISKPTGAITYKNAIMLVIVFLLLTAILMVGVSLFLTNRLERSIRYLLDYIKDYTKGIKEAHTLKKKVQGPQEMEELFYYFNHMIDEVEKNKTGLIELNKELEGRVIDRTAILKNKNLELKAVNEQIRNKHAVLEAVLESMSEGLMLVNNQNKVEYVNEFFLTIAANNEKNELVSHEDVYKRFIALFDVDHDELSSFFADEKGELKLVYRQQFRKPKYYVLHKFSVMLDDTTIGKGLLLRDITKEEEIDTLKNNLISLTSHEFKTPITNIKGSVETLLREEVEWEPEFQQELLEGVHVNIDRILHLVNDWMDISKIESGTMYVERNIVRANHLIEKSIEQIPLSLREDASFHFHNNLPEDFSFYADKMRVQQVLVNLFTNALRYNDASIKKIDITLDIMDDYITIAVSDNGIGISDDHITKIFNRFYQVDVTATRRSGGTGLGLAICVGIMEAHEGKIEVISHPGEGSAFILYFPIKKGREIDET